MRRPYRIRCSTEIGSLELVFFRAREAYLLDTLPTGAVRVVSGTLRRFKGSWQIAHPELVATPEGFRAEGPLRPVYPLTQGLSQRVLARVIRSGLDELPALPEWQDRAWLECQRWPSFGDALRCLHRPDAEAEIGLDAPARRRLAFDELLANQLALGLLRRRSGGGGRALQANGRLRQGVLAALPFRLTPAQERALAEIDADLAAPARMLRLLQGDVGSGKTLVALLAMLSAIEAGGQAALMAPTEILARQHAATLARLLAPVGLAPALLTGRERGAPRRRLLTRPGERRSQARDRHPRAVPGRRRLCRSGARGGRRAASLRRAAAARARRQGRGRPAGDDRDADPAHAGALALRRHGGLGAARQAARPPADRDARDAARPDRGDRGGGRGGAGPGRAAVLGLSAGRRRRGRAIWPPPSSAMRCCTPALAIRSAWCTARWPARDKDAAMAASRAATSACWWPPR